MSKGDTLLVVIVLTHNKRDAVLQCLESLRGLRYRPREVICVDKWSADGSADAVAAAFPEVPLLRSAVNLGAAGGRNLGIRAAAERFGYDYVLAHARGIVEGIRKGGKDRTRSIEGRRPCNADGLSWV